MQRVNYDEIANQYDEPLRDHAVDPNLLDFFASHSEAESSQVRILDVGCGTGKQLAANRVQYPEITMVGVDLFLGMLRVAQKRCPGVKWVQGDGAELPLGTDSFDYATNQFSYPHVQHKEKMIHELFRVLKPGGRFVMTNIDPWSMRDWILYRYFPAARELDFRSFLPADQFVSLMQQAGFWNVQVFRDRQRPQEDLHRFYQYAAQRHRTSQLIAIPDAEYQGGLNQIQHTLTQANDEMVYVDSESCLVVIRGEKPERRAD